jgi:hypothetical protein
MTAQADQTPTLTLRENICEFFVRIPRLLPHPSDIQCILLHYVLYTLHCKKRYMCIPVAPDMLFSGLFIASSTKYYFENPQLVYEMVRHG